MNKFLITLLLLCFAYNADAKVALLSTTKPSDEHEAAYVNDKFFKAITNEMVILDYNKLKSFYFDDAYKEVKELIAKNNITRIIIPGDYYNFDEPPFAPNSNRRMAVMALSRLADEGLVKVMGICGGMQGFLAYHGVQVSNLKKKYGLDPHIDSSYPNAIVINDEYFLNTIRLNPKAKILKGADTSCLKRDANGWFLLSMADSHSEGTMHSAINLERLSRFGLKVVAVSHDNIIEILEDDKGNLLFQGHPEILITSTALYPQFKCSANVAQKMIDNFEGR